MVVDSHVCAPEAPNVRSTTAVAVCIGLACSMRACFMRRVAGAVLSGLLGTATVLLTCLSGAAASERWRQLSDTVFVQVAQDSEVPYASTPMALAEDGDGFLWVGTQGGLARWDGYGFHTYTADPGAPGALPDAMIETLHTDGRGRLWIGTNIGGLSRYDRSSDRFLSYPVGKNGLSSGSVFAIADDGRGGIWVGTSGGLDHLGPDSATFTRFGQKPGDGGISNGCVRALLLDRHGTLWVGLEDGGLVRLRGGTSRSTIVPLPRIDGKPQTVWSLAEDGDGRIWVGTSIMGRSSSALRQRVA